MVTRKTIAADLIAGITGAIVVLPQGVAEKATAAIIAVGALPSTLLPLSLPPITF